MDKRVPFKVIIVFILTLMIICPIAYLSFVKRPVQKAVKVQQIDEIADWKTYIINGWGISFKYPNDFIAVDANNFTELLNLDDTPKEIKTSLLEMKDAGGFKETGAEVILESVNDHQIGYVFFEPSLDISNGDFESYTAKLRQNCQKNKDKYGVDFYEKNIAVNQLRGIQFSSSYKNVLINGELRTGVLNWTVFKLNNKYFAVITSFSDVNSDLNLNKYIDLYQKIINTIIYYEE